MGKKPGTSWFTAVKRAFRSPTKDHDKKREKRRWIFRKPTSQEPPEVPPAPAVVNDDGAAAEKRQALAAARTEEVGLATANYAAITIQTAFRGYLARRALRALKGLVKLQALVRGHNVRKQAKMTLQCMQALVRVQSRVLDQRMRLSHQGSRSSAFSDTATVWDSRYLHELSDRRSMSQSREGSSIADDWDDRPHTIEEVKAMLQHRRDAALKLDKSSSHAFSQQLRRQGRRSPSIGNEEELGERAKRLDRWRATKPWESRGRSSTDQRDTIKTVEMDTSQPYSYLASNFKRTSLSQYQRPSSPIHHRASPNHQSPVTPSPSKARPIQVRSASPRCGREDRSFQSSQTPSLRSNYYYSGNLAGQHHNPRESTSVATYTMPSYMAPTESAKARVRSQSAPRQRPSTPERERSASAAKKRLSFPVPDPYGLRSPSFKSVANSQFGLEQQSIYSSCYTESIAGEVSPSSTSDLRRWLR